MVASAVDLGGTKRLPEDKQALLQRYGGHVVLTLIALLLFVGGRTIAAGQNGEEESAGQPVAANISLAPAGDVVPADLILAGNPQPTPESLIDLSALPVLTDIGLVPVLNPYTFEAKEPEHQLETYVVQAGDTPNRIAERFGIKPETLLGGNPRLSDESSALQTGTTLLILPVDGVLHDVTDGETLEWLAQHYQVPVEDIIAYEPNNLEFPYRLYPNTQILVPGAVLKVFKWTAPKPPSRPSGGGRPGVPSCSVEGTRTFRWPVSGRRITQYYWYGHQAIDVGLVEGTPVIASDTGVVTWAGWNIYGYGNLVVVNHCNGYETYYAHLSSIAVVPGQVVRQGDYVAASGNTGRSSGPHLHFEIRYFDGYLDPMSWLR
jgi:murein DD-endopeptidase MepM/ murein hydrolase activator NlpD